MRLQEWAERLVLTRYVEGAWARKTWAELDDKARQALPAAGVPPSSTVFAAFVEHVKDRIGGPRRPQGVAYALMMHGDAPVLRVVQRSGDGGVVVYADYAIEGDALVPQGVREVVPRRGGGPPTGEERGGV
jgi:hypothetical protein